MNFDEKAREEAKRQAQLDPLKAWLEFQDFATRTEAALPPHLRHNRPRVCPWYQPPGQPPPAASNT